MDFIMGGKEEVNKDELRKKFYILSGATSALRGT
jgi:hypothetical protein